MSQSGFETPMEKTIGIVWLIGLALGLLFGIYSLVQTGNWTHFFLGLVFGLALAGVLNFILASMSQREFATPIEKTTRWIWLLGFCGGVALGLTFMIVDGGLFGLLVGVVLGLVVAGAINLFLSVGRGVNQMTDRLEGRPSREEMKREWEAKQSAEPS